MKLLIADDMEGISGVVDFSHVRSDHPEFQRFPQDHDRGY